MSTPITHASTRRAAKPGKLHGRVNGFLGAFLATMLALPASAGIALPNDPLTTGSRVPPNIMFILDNSGSMALVSMPTLSTDTNFDVQPVGYTGTGTGADRTGLQDNPHDRSYLNNGIYYNPATTYEGWSNPNLSRMTGGTTVSAVYSNWNMASGTTIDLRGNAESIFYVPHAGVTASTSPSLADYDRYRVNSSGVVVKNAVGVRPAASIGLPAGTYSSTSSAVVVTIDITVPSDSDARNLRVFTTGGNNRVRLQLVRPNGTSECTADTGTAGESCSVSSPVTGVWRATLRRDGSGSGANFSGVTIDASIDAQVAALPNPSLRDTQEEELANIATWYSYYRTRLKTAKAGASEAFAGLSRELRIGYTPINGRSSHLSATGTNEIIPVNTNNGLFEGANKTAWFTSVQNAVVQDGSTPLRTALKAVGDYYTRSDSNGPWGTGLPATHLACRQSFSILTTDGYWNDSAPSGIGDSDGDGHSPTLADVADYYYKTDLRTLNNIVPSTDEDPANWQHMSTFGISIGLRGTMTVTDPPPASNAAIWTDPTTNVEDARRIDDLWHASVNGHGRFVAASDPKSFAQGLQAALAKIGERTGSFSNVSANSTTLEAGTYIFQAKYTSAVWTGELLGHNITVPTSTPWKASEGIPTTGRRVYTSNNGAAGAPLAFPGSATTQQLAALARVAPASYPVTGADNAAYIAGTRTLETAVPTPPALKLRARNHVLGDIVTSSPAYVKDTNTVYVGANDGMLHAFNAANGQEVFAYIPNAVNWQDLGTLSRPDYGHRYFVDGPIVVSTRTETTGRNVLAGALGRGGKGLYALDVTDPGQFGAANNVLWEKKADDLLATTADNNIGHVLGKPIIARLNDNSMALIVSNGVNSTGEKAALLIYDLVTGALLKEIDTGVGSTAAPNGLFEGVGWNADGNGTLDYIYAGDMLGNVWKFDLSSTSPTTWGVANSGNALFAATAAQPVTGGLTVAMHPTTFKTWVFFGTGRFMTTTDQTNTAMQSLYGIEDTNSTVPKASLTQRKVVYGETKDGKRQRAAEPNQPLPANSRGWYINLLEPPLPGTQIGERIVSSPQIVGKNLQVNSIIPTNDACGSDGKGYANVFDAFTGTSVANPYWDVNGNRQFTDDVLTYTDAAGNVVTVPVASVDPNVGMLTQGALMSGGGSGGQMCVGGSSGSMVCLGTNESRNVGRVSWREVIRN